MSVINVYNLINPASLNNSGYFFQNGYNEQSNVFYSIEFESAFSAFQLCTTSEQIHQFLSTLNEVLRDHSSFMTRLFDNLPEENIPEFLDHLGSNLKVNEDFMCKLLEKLPEEHVPSLFNQLGSYLKNDTNFMGKLLDKMPEQHIPYLLTGLGSIPRRDRNLMLDLLRKFLKNDLVANINCFPKWVYLDFNCMKLIIEKTPQVLPLMQNYPIVDYFLEKHRKVGPILVAIAEFLNIDETALNNRINALGSDKKIKWGKFFHAYRLGDLAFLTRRDGRLLTVATVKKKLKKVIQEERNRAIEQVVSALQVNFAL